jgi:CDP-2,3-bis-(O-geranylgeranyl)-sn-glycerol synthase
MLQLHVLLLLLVANGAPVIAYDLFKRRWAYPLDGGLVLQDGQRLLGPSCTWRGWASALIATPVAALVLGLSAEIGLLVAGLAMAGDSLSSFIKRRLHLGAGSMALGLDQIPEALLPLLGVQARLQLSGWDLLLLVAGFTLLELLLSNLLFRLHLRNHPY